MSKEANKNDSKYVNTKCLKLFLSLWGRGIINNLEVNIRYNNMEGQVH